MSRPLCDRCGRPLAKGVYTSQCQCKPEIPGCGICGAISCPGGCAALPPWYACARCGQRACACLVSDSPTSATERAREANPKPRNKYLREIKPGVWVDVYDVLAAFTGHYPASVKPIIDHAAKKVLAGGERGHKDLREDMRDVISSMKRVMDKLEESE